MGKYDTIIFDMDGTLLNTLEDLTDSVNYALNIYGFKTRTIEEVRSFVGNGVARLMELAVPDGLDNPKFKECLADFREHYEKNMQNKTRPYDGILDLLKELTDKGYKLAIVSNKFDIAVKGLAAFYFGDYVKIAIGESKTVAKKPAPDSVFKALEELGSTVENAIFVGDSEVDLKTAKNAGLKCISVTWGFCDREVLIQKEADFIIDNPKEVLKIIES